MEDAEARSSPANQSPTVPTESPTDFIHSPINYCAPSIRLVRIQASKSSDGFIQCQMRHASTASTYLCLSYVWGADDSFQWILVNGQRFRIRKNLYNFLEEARQQPQWQSHWFWIDAICIDQSNSTEKNHQVKQMGDIFAGAVQVVAWLGMHEWIVTFLETSKILGECVDVAQKSLKRCRGKAGITVGNTCAPLGSSDEDEDRHDARIAQANADGFRPFCHADYWDRAWITQEVALARHITFMAGKASLAGSSIIFDYNQYSHHRIQALDPRKASELRGRSLIYLLEQFKYKVSGVIRDRVFSLLSLCGDGSDVVVDYDATDLQVAENVLNCCKRTFCVCSIGIVVSVLRVQTELSISRYVLNSRLDFARITLPVITDLRIYNYDVTSHALYRPSCLTLSIRMLCRSYRGILHVCTDHMGTTESVRYRHKVFGERRIHPIEGCRIDVSTDQRFCTLFLSLAFLYDITQKALFQPPCCERVSNDGTPSAWPSSMSGVTMCD